MKKTGSVDLREAVGLHGPSLPLSTRAQLYGRASGRYAGVIAALYVVAMWGPDSMDLKAVIALVAMVAALGIGRPLIERIWTVICPECEQGKLVEGDYGIFNQKAKHTCSACDALFIDHHLLPKSNSDS